MKIKYVDPISERIEEIQKRKKIAVFSVSQHSLCDQENWISAYAEDYRLNYEQTPSVLEKCVQRDNREEYWTEMYSEN
jgi:hypothetical protein